MERVESLGLPPALLVLVGSALGGLARYGLATLGTALLGPAFPWATLLINVLGSLVIGTVAATTDAAAHPAFRAFLMVGLCGGFTTFSSFSLQSLELMQAGRLPAALAYIGASVALCLAAVYAGWLLGKVQWT